MIRISPLLVFLLLSCGPNTADGPVLTEETDNPGRDSLSRAKWTKVNNALFKNNYARIERADIKMAYDVLVNGEFIDPTIKINNLVHPHFCHLSPTEMLESILRKNEFQKTKYDSTRVITFGDKEFMMDQYRLNTWKMFRWDYITTTVDTGDFYPQYRISIPIFSYKKNTFIVCIEHYTARDIFQGRSHLFIKEGALWKHRFFEIPYGMGESVD